MCFWLVSRIGVPVSPFLGATAYDARVPFGAAKLALLSAEPHKTPLLLSEFVIQSSPDRCAWDMNTARRAVRVMLHGSRDLRIV